MGDTRHSNIDRYTSDLIRIKARRLVGYYGFTRDDLEDLEQDLTLDVLERMSMYDEHRGSLRTFIDRITTHKIANIIRDRRRLKRDYSRIAWSLDEEVTTDDGHAARRGDGISQDDFDLEMGTASRSAIERHDMCMDIARYFNVLSPSLQLVAVLLTATSTSRTAEALGVPRGPFYGRELAQLRERFKDKE